MGNNFLRSILHIERSVLGKGLVKFSIVIAMVALKFVARKQSRKSAMPRLRKKIDKSIMSGCRYCRNPADNDASELMLENVKVNIKRKIR